MYRNFHTYFWNDPKIKKWPALARYQFSYLFTNEHSHLCGLYHLRIAYMQDDLSLSKKLITDHLKIYEGESAAFFDYEREIIWVVKMLFHQTHGNPGPKNIVNISEHLETLHKSPLIDAFLQHYKDLAIPYRYPIQTCEGISGYPPVSVPVPDKSSARARSATTSKIHIDKLEMSSNMVTYAEAHGIGNALKLFQRMLTWCEKNGKLQNTQRGWEAQFRTFVDRAPQYNPDLCERRQDGEYVDGKFLKYSN